MKADKKHEPFVCETLTAEHAYDPAYGSVWEVTLQGYDTPQAVILFDDKLQKWVWQSLIDFTGSFGTGVLFSQVFPIDIHKDISKLHKYIQKKAG